MRVVMLTTAQWMLVHLPDDAPQKTAVIDQLAATAALADEAFTLR
jgi:hypothetical protein